MSSPKGGKEELQELKTNLRRFKTEGSRTFSKNQASVVGTQNWHALDHFLKILERLGDIRYAHAGFYEAAHKVFNETDWKRFLWRWSVMDELVRRKSYFLEYQHWFLNRRFRRSKVSASLSKAAKDDGAYLVWSGPLTTLGDLDRHAYANQEQKKFRKVYQNICKLAEQVFKDIAYDGNLIFIRL